MLSTYANTEQLTQVTCLIKYALDKLLKCRVIGQFLVEKVNKTNENSWETHRDTRVIVFNCIIVWVRVGCHCVKEDIHKCRFVRNGREKHLAVRKTGFNALFEHFNAVL